MLVKAIRHTYPDGWGRMGFTDTLKGKFKGKTITIDRYGYIGKGVKEKQITIDGPNFQKIVNKTKNENGKFDVLG